MMNSVTKTIGKHQPKKVIASSLAIAIIVILYCLSIGSYFEPDVYRFEERLTYHQLFEGRYFFNGFIDHLIISLCFLVWAIISIQHKIIKWMISISTASIIIVSITNISEIPLGWLALVSLPFVIVANILDKTLRQPIVSGESFVLILNYILISVAILSIYSLFVSISSFDINDPFIDVFVLLSRFSPVVMFLFIFYLPLKLLYDYVCKNLQRLRTRILEAADSFESVYTRAATHRFDRIHLLLIIGSSMALSMVIVLIPNTDNISGPIAEDTLMYVNWIEELQSSSNFEEILHKGFVGIAGGDRPLPLFLIHLLSISLPLSTVTILELILPMFLAPSLVLITYYLTRELSPNILIALFACFAAAISFQVVIGMYAGLFANWIALLPSYISLVYMLRFLKTSHRMDLYLFGIFLVILLFMHIYTWTIMMIFVFLFAIILWIKKKYSSSLLKLIFVTLVIVVGIDVVRGLTTGSTLGLTRDLVLAETTGYGFAGFDEKWNNLVHTTQVFKAGIFGNVIFLLLAFYGLMLIRYKNVVDIFLLLFASISILPFFFGDKIILSRVLYDIPFQIPVGLAMTNIFLSRYGKLKGLAVVLSLLASVVYIVFNIGSIEQNI
jgi:hypothetical protein